MKVTKEQFEQALTAYGREKLTGDTTGLCDPPRTRFHDFSGGKKWPEGLVAYIVRNSLDEFPGPDEYFIEDEFAHLLSSPSHG
jgi:hypothetical protein